MSSVDSPVLAQILAQLASLQLSQQVLQAKVSFGDRAPIVDPVADIVTAA